MAERRVRGNAYLTLAHQVLYRARRPLTPNEILQLGRADGLVPGHLFGATMHRTLGARLSENIRAEGSNSLFYRTGPATFFLRDLASDPSTPDEYRNVYIGHLRSKAIRRESVLVSPRDELSKYIYGEYVPYDERAFEHVFSSSCRFLDRSAAELDNTVKQFVTFTLVIHSRMLLYYRRGKFTTASDRLKGQLSVGFGGHVNDSDFDLFSRGSDAFKFNAARELREELFLDDVYPNQYDAVTRSKVVGFINEDGSPDAEQHIAVLVLFNHVNRELPRKGELSINQLAWLDLNTPLNDLSDFDHWSALILRNIYQGNISVDC